MKRPWMTRNIECIFSGWEGTIVVSGREAALVTSILPVTGGTGEFFRCGRHPVHDTDPPGERMVCSFARSWSSRFRKRRNNAAG